MLHGRILTPVALLLALSGCGTKEDAAELGANLPPFSELKGTDLGSLTVKELRERRSAAEAAPLEGLREQVGAYDLLYMVEGFVGADGQWPPEGSTIRELEATREWPSDESARAAWDGIVREVKESLRAEPRCIAITGRDFTLRVAQWERPGDWTLSAVFAPAATLSDGATLSARHSVALRKIRFDTRFPEVGAPNPDARPTWSRVECNAP